MKIFVLEDSLERIELFRQRLHNHQVTYCDDVEVAKDILKKGSFSILFLDHDLDNRIFVKSNEPNTGYQLAKWLKETGLTFDQIFIHSMNPIGVKNIEREVEGLAPEIYTIPFPALIRAI